MKMTRKNLRRGLENKRQFSVKINRDQKIKWTGGNNSLIDVKDRKR